jgi:hypothetical protein
METEPTTALTLPSSGNASSDDAHYLIEAYLAEEEVTIPIYGCNTRVALVEAKAMFILISSMAALLTVVLRGVLLLPSL